MEVKDLYHNYNKRDDELRRKWITTRESCDYWLKNTIDEYLHNEKNNALIVGAGHCDDFKLETVAEIFSRVDIIDFDEEAVRNAIEKIPGHLQKKINVYSGDVTGVIEEAIPQLEKILENEGYQNFIKSAEKFRDGLPRTFKPNIGLSLRNEYDFIFSDSITTQLFGPAFVSIFFSNNDVENLYVKNIQELEKLIKTTTLRILSPYLKLLCSALKKGGVLALSSDTVEINNQNRKRLEKELGSFYNMAKKYLLDEKTANILNEYLIVGSNPDVLRTVRDKKIRLKTNDYRVSWPWTFSKDVQYINVGISYTK